jgi:hypothetical protein
MTGAVPLLVREAPSHACRGALDVLQTVWPKSEGAAWLHPVWEAGDYWNPARFKGGDQWRVERWVIYQMFPPAFVTPMQRLACEEDAPPRSQGAWVQPEPAKPPMYDANGQYIPAQHAQRGHWRTEALVSQTQYDLYHATGGHFGRPLWVVQGSNGGHRRKLKPKERMLLKLAGRAQTDVPLMGDLPYAPIDFRVIHALLERDSLMYWNAKLADDQRQGLADRNEGAAFRRTLLDWFDKQVAQAVDGVPKGSFDLGTFSGERDDAYDEGAEDEQFIHAPTT